MDIKKMINEIVDKVKNDKDIAAKFAKDPVKTVEGLVGMDLPDDQVKMITDQVQNKLAGKADGIGGVVSKVKGLFG
ncbi:MAG: hypothetical protein J5950_08085 [Clostridia bacterium]|nr:hypothetical protein [Clostridia bacterium]